VLTAGWNSLFDAYGINDRGQIAGSGVINGASHAFFLTPSGEVPEPSVSLLVLAGVVRRAGERKWNLARLAR
jgi:hypothetical protein